MIWFEVWSGMTHALGFGFFFFFMECSRAGLSRVCKESTAVSTVEAAGLSSPFPSTASCCTPSPQREKKTRTDARQVHPKRDGCSLLLTH